MRISIGDNNKIRKSVIGKNNRATPTGGGITKELVVGVVVTVIGGVLLALILGMLGLSNP